MVLSGTLYCTVRSGRSVRDLHWEGHCSGTVTMGNFGRDDSVTMRAPQFSLNRPLGRYCISAMSVCLYVCVPVTIQNSHFPVSWRLTVKGCIANFGLQSHKLISSLCFDDFLRFSIFSGFWKHPYVNQPNVDNG